MCQSRETTVIHLTEIVAEKYDCLKLSLNIRDPSAAPGKGPRYGCAQFLVFFGVAADTTVAPYPLSAPFPRSQFLTTNECNSF